MLRHLDRKQYHYIRFHVPLDATFYKVSIPGTVGEDLIGVFGAKYFPSPVMN